MLQNLSDSLKQERHDISRTHKIMMNWYMHYSEVHEQLQKSIENLSDILQVRNNTINIKLLQRLEDQITMEQKRILYLQE